jgi:hypothetical protein
MFEVSVGYALEPSAFLRFQPSGSRSASSKSSKFSCRIALLVTKMPMMSASGNRWASLFDIAWKRFSPVKMSSTMLYAEDGQVGLARHKGVKTCRRR